MIRRHALWLTTLAVTLAIGASVGFLVWFHRLPPPTVEYAYVDIVDPRLLVRVVAGALLSGVAIGWWLRRQKRDQHGR